MKKDKYEILEIAEILPSIEGWCKAGTTFEELAVMLHVSKNTIYKWRKKHPEFAKAIRDGLVISNGAVLNAAYKQAVGYKEQVTELLKVKRQRYDPESRKVLTDEDYKIFTYERTIEPCERMTRFMLMNRFPEIFRVRQDPVSDSAFEVIFKGMTDEEVAKLMV